ncbi:MAG: peptidoglycan DD-metalloendopeptidase family protein [Bacteroidota bacterium]|jgi:murein DD-endopeptidase MepM/ murein hydrolase activator NlpD|nr:peptidoglycan DD-metalloendopeptidase family protein [Bacteroidota bacterium]
MDALSEFYERIAEQQNEPAFVVPFDAHTDSIVAMDFTANNVIWTNEVVNDVQIFTKTVQGILQKAHAKYGIGGYLEHRNIYARSQVFDAAEPRRIHLGIDIWGEAQTPVMAPVAGTVHSFAFNNAYGDYGATIILQHELKGLRFFSLYGHLALASIQNLKEGQCIDRGAIFAWLGMPEENGFWPPHLHFQLILNMENFRGDYPGVCAASQLEHYAQNCPNPEVILQMRPYAIANF